MTKPTMFRREPKLADALVIIGQGRMSGGEPWIVLERRAQALLTFGFAANAQQDLADFGTHAGIAGSWPCSR